MTAASNVSAQAPEDLVGAWQRVFRPGLPIMQEGQVIQYRIRLESDGQLTGTAWNGNDRLAHLRVTRVEIGDGHVRFVHPAANHYYEGRLTEGGRSIVGVETASRPVSRHGPHSCRGPVELNVVIAGPS